MAEQDFDDHVRRQLRTLQRVVGNPSDAVLARRSGIAAATFSEVMSGKRRPRAEFVAKVVSGCLVCARASGHASLDEQRILRALRLPGHTASDGGILERDDDLNRCSAVLDAMRARSGATILIEGPAGIGKSELVAHICAEAAARGIVPLSVRGNERDQTIAFGAVRTLLARWVIGRGSRERQALFAGAAACARIPLGVPQTHGGTPASMIGLTEALYWLVVNATYSLGAGRAEEGLLFAVDDAHWLDEESLSWLEFLSERLAGLPVVLALAYRLHEPRSAPALNRLALRADETVRPRPLSHDAVRTFISRGLLSGQARGAPVQAPDDRFCAAFLEHSGGNPFYLRWMLDVARERGLAPTATDSAAVGTLTPRHVVLYLNVRLNALGPAAQRLAHTIGVLGPGCQLERAAPLAGLTLEEVKRQYDLLCNAAILAPGPTVDFCHPIIRSAVYDAIDPSRRSDLHYAAARLLHEQNADSDVIAAHLLEVNAAADPWVVDQLVAAAADALASGLSNTAARYFKRAVEEPPSPARQCHVRLRYGQALALGQVAAAVPELLTAYREAPNEPLRTHAAIALAKTYSYADQLGDSVRLLDTAIERCTDEQLRERLVAEQLLWATWWADDPLRLDRMRLLDRIAPPLAGATGVQRLLISTHAWSLVLRGRPRAAALAAIQPVIRRGVVFPDVEQGMEVATMTGFVHLYSDHLTVAAELFNQARSDFDRNGWRGTHLAFTHVHLGNIALRQGRLADAVAETEIALRLADRTGKGTPAEWFATGTLMEALLARGEIERAAALCVDRGYGGRQPDAVILPVPKAVLGMLALAKGNTAEAIRTLRDIGRSLDAGSVANPSMCPWRLDLAQALRQSAPREAHDIATAAQQQADRFGSPSVRGRAARTLAAFRRESAVDLLEESARILLDAPNRWEYAQTLTQLGIAFSRTARVNDARTALTTALTLADECGAISLRPVIERHLRQTGAIPTQPRRANTLAPRVQRVAQLAAEGRSAADIAHTMALSLDSVNTCVRDAYERLGANTHTELRRALAH